MPQKIYKAEMQRDYLQEAKDMTDKLMKKQRSGKYNFDARLEEAKKRVEAERQSAEKIIENKCLANQLEISAHRYFLGA